MYFLIPLTRLPSARDSEVGGVVDVVVVVWTGEMRRTRIEDND